ncbi:MAG: transcription antitermination factor NusB [Candidatus Dasytiphilus stammeri]
MNPLKRRRARECAIQAIYSWQLSGNKIAEVYQFIKEQNLNFKEVDQIYFNELIGGVTDNYIALDNLMQPCLMTRRINEIGNIEKAILRISIYELSKRQDIPYKVVINEGIELAKIFGAEDSHKFVNGVLNNAAKKIRLTLPKLS